MEIFLLGAGLPAKGIKPSPLKRITINTRALDWQIRSFSGIDNTTIHFLGGYHAEEVISNYTQLKYTVIPNWDEQTVLHTLLESPLPDSGILVSYADTIFRTETITQFCNMTDDVVVGIDSTWKRRYQDRGENSLASAEIISQEQFDINHKDVEFTGLIYFL